MMTFLFVASVLVLLQTGYGLKCYVGVKGGSSAKTITEMTCGSTGTQQCSRSKINMTALGTDVKMEVLGCLDTTDGCKVCDLMKKIYGLVSTNWSCSATCCSTDLCNSALGITPNMKFMALLGIIVFVIGKFN